MDNIDITSRVETAVYNTIDNILLKSEVKYVIGFINKVNSYYLNSILSDTAMENIKAHIYRTDQDVILDFIISLINNLKYELGTTNLNSLVDYYIDTYNDVFNSELNTVETRNNISVSKSTLSISNRPIVCVILIIKQHIKFITTTLISYDQKLENIEGK